MIGGSRQYKELIEALGKLRTTVYFKVLFYFNNPLPF